MNGRKGTARLGQPAPKSNAAPGVPTRRRTSLLGIITAVPPGWWFPLVVMLAVTILGAAKLSGSSVSLDAPRGASSGLIAGRARGIRSDEFTVETPLVVRQATLNFSRRNLIGVGEHDMVVAAPYSIPTSGWETLLRPDTFPYRVFGVERAFALQWWIRYLALPALGLYALGLALGVRTLIAALASLIVVFSPAVQWWTGAAGAIIGYSCLAGAVVLLATRSETPRRRLGWAVAAGWIAACAVLVLYPAWLVPMALVVGAVTVAAIARSVPPPDQRQGWWRAIAFLAVVTATVAAALVLAYFVAHRDALNAITNSVYPGRRRNRGGGGSLAILLNAPFDVIAATRPSSSVAINGINQSEAAAGLFTALAITAAWVTDYRRAVLRGWRNRVVLLTLLGASAALLAWYLLPVPDIVGRMTFFNRVPAGRVLLPLAVAGALCLALFVNARLDTGAPLRWHAVLAGVVAFTAVTLWSGRRLLIDGQPVSRWQLAVVCGVYALGIGAALRGRVSGLWLLTLLVVAGGVVINPLQQGLGPLIDSPAARLGQELRRRPTTGTVLEIRQDPSRGGGVRSGLTASGVDLLSGVNFYPNTSAFRVFDARGTYRDAWDRYSNAYFGAGVPGSKPTMSIGPVGVIVWVDLCDPRLARFNVHTVVSTDPVIQNRCLAETDRVSGGGGTSLYVYRIVPANR